MRGHIDPTRPHATTPIPTRSDASSGHPAFPRGDDEVVPPLLRSLERPQGAILAPGIVQVLDQSPLPGERPEGAREPAPHARDRLPTADAPRSGRAVLVRVTGASPPHDRRKRTT